MIENKFGRSFPSGLVFLGYVIFAISVLIAFESLIFGLILALISGFFCFTSSGIEIDVQNKLYKDYTRFFGIKRGKWESLTEFPYMTILRKNMVTTVHSPGNVASTSSKEIVYDVCLLNKTHRKKLVIKRLKDKEKAKLEANILAEKLEVEQVAYSPEISEATRARRR